MAYVVYARTPEKSRGVCKCKGPYGRRIQRQSIPLMSGSSKENTI